MPRGQRPVPGGAGQRARGRPAGVSAAGREVRSRSPLPCLGLPLDTPPVRVRFPAQRRQGWRRRPHPQAAWGSRERKGCERAAAARGGVPDAGRSSGRADRSPRKPVTGTLGHSSRLIRRSSGVSSPRRGVRSCAALRAGLEACRDLFLLGEAGARDGRREGTRTRGASNSPRLAFGLGSPWGRKKLCLALKEDNSPPTSVCLA